MALLIKETCINCDMCEPECPNNAISMGFEIYEINPNLCTECVGFYPEPTCKRVCPIDKTIITDPNYQESKKELKDKFDLLNKNNKN